MPPQLDAGVQTRRVCYSQGRFCEKRQNRIGIGALILPLRCCGCSSIKCVCSYAITLLDVIKPIIVCILQMAYQYSKRLEPSGPSCITSVAEDRHQPAFGHV